MGGRLRITDEHHVIGNPVLAPDRREIAPDGAVADQPMTLQLFGKYLLHEARGGFLAHVAKPSASECLRIRFQNPGRMIGLVLVTMRYENSVLSLPEKEIEGV